MEARIPGLAASQGFACGRAAVLRPLADARRIAGPPAGERAALHAAIAAAIADLIRLQADEAGEAAEILGFQIAMLEDDALAEAAYAAIATGAPADGAWKAALDAEIAGYEAAEDAYFRARAVDLQDIRDRVLRPLVGASEGLAGPAGAIIVADDLKPSAFLAIDWSRGGGIVLGHGSPSSHVAMLARARGIPMVVGIGSGWTALAGDLIVDGAGGTVIVDPAPATLAAAMDTIRIAAAARSKAEDGRFAPAMTQDGTRIAVLVNIARLEDVSALAPESCDGIGLTRTEFLIEDALNDEARQFERYAALLRWAAGRPVTIRTLDAGGDKPVPGYTIDGEANPFLGVRGVRLSLRHPEIFKVQLRALARAAVIGPLKIMVPMVTNAADFAAARRLFDEALAELAARGAAAGRAEFGMMVEVPAAALAPEMFAADFFSIGSNDLTQYATAASRDDGAVARYNDVLHPGVMAMIGHVARFGLAENRDVSLCGDAGGDPRAVPALLAAGIRAVSVAPGLLGATKAAIRAVDLGATGPRS